MISVILPVLDEEEAVGEALVALAGQPMAVEVIVADGGSRDRTREVAVRHGARVVVAEPGRGRQMNAGARAARGESLVFLHVDTRLPFVLAAGFSALLAVLVLPWFRRYA